MSQNIATALDAYRNYGSSVREQIVAPRKLVAERSTDASLRKILDRKIRRVELALSSNEKISDAIYDNAQRMLKSSNNLSSVSLERCQFTEGVARSAIRQLWRDWSSDPDSQQERKNATNQLRMSLSETFSQQIRSRKPRILVPGSGLGRFAIDLMLDGYNVEANDISAVHLLAVAWILNETSNMRSQIYQVFPWTTQFSNHADSNRQFESYNVPIIEVPHNIPQPRLITDESGAIELEAGNDFRIRTWDFVQGYGPPLLKEPNTSYNEDLVSSTSSVESLDTGDSSPSSPRFEPFDVVATLFFIDTAQNVLDYIKTVYHALHEGGVWVNSGPLLWNAWENGPSGRGEGDNDQDETAQSRGVRSSAMPGSPSQDDISTVPSVELTWDELLELIEMNGFQVVESNYGEEAGFVHDVQSMGIYGYKIGFFKAIKDSRH